MKKYLKMIGIRWVLLKMGKESIKIFRCLIKRVWFLWFKSYCWSVMLLGWKLCKIRYEIKRKKGWFLFILVFEFVVVDIDYYIFLKISTNADIFIYISQLFSYCKNGKPSKLNNNPSLTIRCPTSTTNPASKLTCIWALDVP